MKDESFSRDARGIAQIMAGADGLSGVLVDEDGALTSEILDIMEQGIIQWSAEGICKMHNNRIYRVLELSGGDIQVGSSIEDFCERAVARGEIDAPTMRYHEGQVNAHQPFTFDLKMPSGRMVLTNGRPTRGGGYVVTFTDVTQTRRAAHELDAAKRDAEEARSRTEAVLTLERARQKEAQLLASLDEWLQSCKSLDELFRIVRTFMVKLLPGSAGELYVYSNSRDVLDGVCSWNIDGMASHITPDSCWSLRRGRQYEFTREGLCFVCDHVEDAIGADAGGGAHYICVPVVAHGDTVGLLHYRLDDLRGQDSTVEDPVRFAARCGEHISMAIANVKLRDELRDQSIRDPLTGLFNRRHFMEAMRRQMAVGGPGFGLISLDADHFKAFNDNHGHDAGDMVLRMIGDTLGDLRGTEAVGCRMGGEEFAVLLPGASRVEAHELADQLREAIAATQVRYLDKVLPPVTLSAGVASWPADGPDAASVLRRADTALYLAKDGGRNRVCQPP